GLVEGLDGNFYGTTEESGANGFGIVYRITPGGDFTDLHDFADIDGAHPVAPLMLASDGKFYGTTTSGGAFFAGALFEITPQGSLTTIYNLDCESEGCPDNSTPYGGLTQDTSGILYGTTFQYNGTVFSFQNGLGLSVKPVLASARPGTAVTIL